MNLRALLQNRNFLIAAGVIVVVAVIGLIVMLARPNGLSSGGDPDDKKTIDGKVELVTSENLGKIIEIEALLARYKIQTKRDTSGGSKVTLLLKDKSTIKQRVK